MRVVWVMVGAVAGLAIGSIAGFAAAMVAMSYAPKHNDGTDGMREVLVCLPGGAIIGLVAGVWWGLTTAVAIN